MCADSQQTVDSSKMKDGQTLYDRLGGEVGTEAIIEYAFEKVLSEDRVRFYFEKAKAKIRGIRRKMCQCISTVTGGPVQYDMNDIRTNHYPMNNRMQHCEALPIQLLRQR